MGMVRYVLGTGVSAGNLAQFSLVVAHQVSDSVLGGVFEVSELFACTGQDNVLRGDVMVQH